MQNIMMGGIVFVIWLGLIVISIYVLILLIMLMQRGIKLLDIYIAKNNIYTQKDYESDEG